MIITASYQQSGGCSNNFVEPFPSINVLGRAFTFTNITKEGSKLIICIYDSIATVGEIRVYWRADFQSGSRVLKKVF